MISLKKLKTAIVYDRVNKFGGAERVLMVLREMFPDAPLYTSVYNPKKARWAKKFKKIYTSFIQKIPFIRDRHELLGWLMPIAFEQFNFDKYDLVISVTSEAAKGIITGGKTFHVSYVLTPTRYLWSGYNDYFRNKLFKFITLPIVNYLRVWDKKSSKRADAMIAISTEVKKRIKKYYKRDSEIIFPPADLKRTKRVKTKGGGGYYLIVSRLVPYKKVDLVVETFNDLNLPLIVVGSGSEERKLKAIANKNVKFLGNVSDKKLISIYQRAKAFIMPQNEDFGITSVEAQSFGVPVIAFKKGGALDTVVDRKTGVFFNRQSKKELKQAIANFDTISFNRNYIIKHAEIFSKERFKRRIQKSLIRTYTSWRRRNKTLAKVSK